MRVIFLKDVPRVGRKYELKNVSDGYVKNFLLPKGLVEIATDKSLSRLEEIKKTEETERMVREDLLVKNVMDLEGKTIVIKEKANDKGHLFAGIHGAEIVKTIKKETNLDLDPSFIELEKPIRETGEHTISVSAHGKKAKFTLIVEAA